MSLKQLVDEFGMDIKGVYHIGAHFGEELESYEQCGVKNMVFFEPLRPAFDVLARNVGNKGLTYNIALGNQKGRVLMHVESANNGQSSSILEPSIHLFQYPHIIFEGQVQVDIDTLDNVVREDNLTVSGYNMINIDVQGYELEVFKGAVETLPHIDYIITEVNNDEVYADCVLVGELDEFLGGFGFKRVKTTWDGGTWGDALYVKA